MWFVSDLNRIMSEFEHNFDDELLSAYLDDELSPEERARVEARLASDPAARQMLDQFRTASQAVKGLPHESVGQDLRESILRRAEAAMLTGGGRSVAAAKKSVSADDTVSLRDSLPRITIGQTRRGWVWAALAIAAGIAIMVFQPGGQQNTSDLSDLAAARRSEPLDRVEATDGAEIPSVHEMPASEPVAAPAATDHDYFAAAPPAGTANAPVATGAASPAPSSVAVDETQSLGNTVRSVPREASSARRDSGGTGNYGVMTESAPGSAGQLGIAAEQSSRAGGAIVRGPALQATDQLGDRVSDAEAERGSESAVALNGPVSASGAISGRELAEVPPQGAVGGVPLNTTTTRQLASAEALAKSPAQSPAANVVVVRVVAAPEALRSKTFESLLTKHGIQFEESREADAVSASAGEELREEVKLNRAMKRTASDDLQKSNEQPAEDAILVAAPKATIDSCLSELKGDEANYIGIEIDDPTARIAADKAKGNIVPQPSVPAKTLADDLRSRFNRGQVPPESTEQVRKRWYFYDSNGDSADRNKLAFGGEGGRGAGLGGGGGFSGGSQKQEQEQLEQRADRFGMGAGESLGRGRARRIQSWGADNQPQDAFQPRGGKLAEDRASVSTSSSLELDAMSHSARATTDSAGDNLRVLFLLSPDTRTPAAATPSRAAGNRQE